jgi:ankyrin repeat protein
LHLAAEKGFLTVAETLLDHKADVNSRDGNQTTPLREAAMWDRVEMVKTLLAHGADVNAKDIHDSTPLAEAVNQGRTGAVNALLAAKADVNTVDGSGQTPLSIAAWNSQGNLVKELLDANADPNRGTINMPLSGVINTYYADMDRTSLCERLLRAGADPSKFARIIQRGSVFSGSPIELAVWQNETNVVKMLLDYKADANGTEVWASNPTITLLMEASSKSNILMAKALLAHGAEVNARDASGDTALAYAIGSRSPETVALLINNKADLNVQDNQGRTPLHIAKQMQGPGQPGASTPAGDIVILLRQHGALDELPDFSKIRVTREGFSGPAVIFER